MKIISVRLYVFLCLIAAVVSQNLILWPNILLARAICRLGTLVDPNLCSQIQQCDFDSKDERLKKYVYCLYHYLGIMNDKGHINKQAGLNYAVESNNPILYLNAVDQCKSQKGKEVSDVAYETLRCMCKEYPQKIPIF